MSKVNPIYIPPCDNVEELRNAVVHQLALMARQVADRSFREDIVANEHRITRLGDPVRLDDAVNLKTLKKALRPEEEIENVNGGDIPTRTLTLYNTAIGNDISPHTTTYVAGTPSRVVGVLRLPILSALTVRIKLDGVALITCTIPSSTAVDAPVEFTSFSITSFTKDQVLTADITASDDSWDVNAVAQFTLEWTPA
jgi:hypothetical protein